MLVNREELPRIQQEGERWGDVDYVDKGLFETTRNVSREDTHEEIERKSRAFFYPPYPGALFDIRGEKYTLVDKNLM
jgi:methionyl-tRNA formyltransferase